MDTVNHASQETQPTILSFLKDWANICSLAGLACTILAIYYSILGNYFATMIGMIWAVAFDWADGLIARSMKGRTSKQGFYGGQLDSLIDIVNYGVSPAILLLSIGQFDSAFLPGAFIIIATGAIRLSYFNTYGLSSGTKYTGMALDNNNIILVFIFLFQNFFSEGAFSIILYTSCLGLAALNVSEIKTPKLSINRSSVYFLAMYTLGISGIYIWKLL
ncbi:MAG: CDP-alcohol phosphatidyltransferase [Methylococcales symbiont of Hymedesmia sp. n. MRB-2018]|nr:MAG: CDP-alcohol phosphatidyltransferase [Methylococcales symbiont of Hymedesmia sp. n. MRB-2018]KAF3984841.1 MAG: CDP-alcohol phosphatidyltransferase [Methylococcales symbiont of Hymedesmia sp. n. MRB-2018]